MIECTENNIWYKKRKKKPFKRFFSLFIVAVIILTIFLYYNFFIVRQIFKVCADYSYSVSIESINSAVLISLDKDINYSELVTIEKNNAGEIVLMQTNSLKVNSINKEVSFSAKTLINHSLNKGIPVPFLAFTGISFLSGYGGNVNLKIINNVSVDCSFVSKFVSVGINQTLHSIYLQAKSIINLEIPLNNRSVESESQILISETVLIGKVPDIYLKEGLFN